MTAALPDSIAPMLARTGRAFDSDEHLFEVKWDGLRAIAFVTDRGHRIQNRRGTDVTARYPELAGLSSLPPGVVLDGEIVVIRDGKPDFQLLQARWNVRDPKSAAVMAGRSPATYVAFDLLFQGFEALYELPLARRRERLAKLLETPRAGIVFSDGVVGAGIEFFEAAAGRGLEGIVAKRLASRYRPATRSDAWTKIKSMKTMHCVIVGFLTRGRSDLKSVLLAAPDEDGTLRYVGRVGSGFTERQRADLLAELEKGRRPAPLIPCGEKAEWVEPELYCAVRFLELTRGGHLRAPVFLGLVER